MGTLVHEILNVTRAFQIGNQKQQILFLIYSIFNLPLGVGEDSFVWKLKCNDEFDVHSFYEALKGSNQELFPKKVASVAWTCKLGKILTVDQSSKGIRFLLIGVVCVSLLEIRLNI